MLPRRHIILIAVLSLLCIIFIFTTSDKSAQTNTSIQPTSSIETLNTTSSSAHNETGEDKLHASNKSKQKPIKPTTFRTVEQIRDSGYITAVKLNWESQKRLPRSGSNSLYHHHLLEKFSEKGGIEIRWVTVDNLEEMFVAIEEYKADIIPRHLAITENRLARVNFTYPIAIDHEVLISRLDTKPVNLKDEITVSLPVGSSFIETAQEHAPHWQINQIPQALTSDDLADKIIAGNIDYGMIDQSEFEALTKYRNDIKVVLTMPKRVQHAWAVHKDNHALAHRLNEIISYYHANKLTSPNRIIDIDTIKKKKLSLRVITRNSPETYFLWKGELLGFEYELMKKFSKYYNTKLEIIVADSYKDMLEMLQNGEGDVIAAGLTRTAERLKDFKVEGLMSSIRYNRVDEQLVAHKDSAKIHQLEDLKGRTITIRKSSSFWKTAQDLASTYGATLVEADEMTSTELLIADVDNKEIDLTIADSNITTIEKQFRENITTPLTLNESVPYSYIIRQSNPKLLEHLNQFIRVHYRKTFYNVVKNRYFHPQRFDREIIEDRLITGSSLSPYDDFVRTNAHQYNFDWRLIISQMYQESKFNPKAKSYAGALGLMQVLPRTGHELGITDLTNPEQSIIAGIRYLDWVRDRFPQDLAIQEKVLFSLASYNAGYGHVKDAQRLAKQLGLKDDVWFNNVEKAMLLLQKRHYYKQARFGYVRGSEPVKYVYNIHQRYLAYVQSTSR
jgi:membrane-bound lytic murein transglycosylase F